MRQQTTRTINRLAANRMFRLLAGLTVIAIVLYFVFQTVNLQWDEFTRHEIAFTPYYLIWIILALTAILSALLIHAAAWTWIVNVLYGKVSYSLGLQVFFLSQLGRYIPGKLWTFMGRFSLTLNPGVPKSVLTESIFYEMCALLSAGATLFSLTFLFYGREIGINIEWLTVLVLTGVVAFLLFPRYFFFLANRLLKRLGKQTISSNILSSHLCAYFFFNLCLWLLHRPRASARHTGVPEHGTRAGSRRSAV